MSAGFSNMLIFTTWTFSESMISLTKWSLTSIRFYLSWNNWFFVKWIALWLSQCTNIVLCSRPRSFMNYLIHMDSLTAYVTTIYLGSVVERATTGGNIDFQLVVVPYIQNTYLVRDLLESKLHAKSRSTHPYYFFSSLNSTKVHKMFIVPLMYPTIHFKACQCSLQGLLMNLLTKLIAYAKSDLLQIIAYLMLPI